SDGGWLAAYCVDPSDGSPCLTTAEGFCLHPWSTCEKAFGLSSWLGLCEDGECPADCSGKACKEDDGCGTPCLSPCLANGQGCADGGQCLSGHCVDGACCSAPCNGPCVSCTLAGSMGTCSGELAGTDPGGDCGPCSLCNGFGACLPVPAGQDPMGWCGACETCSGGACAPVGDGLDPAGDCGGCETCDGSGACRPVAAGLDPDGDCDLEDGATCGLTGSCDGTGGCAFWGPEQVCEAPYCLAGIATGVSTCNGTGGCAMGLSDACHPYGCDAGGIVCASTCDEHGECAQGYWCPDGACEIAPTCPLAATVGCGVQLVGSTQGSPSAWTAYDSCTGLAKPGPEKTYKLQLNQDARVTLTLSNQTYDAALLVLETWCAPAEACVASVDEGDLVTDEILVFDAKAATPYRLVVDGEAPGVGGQFGLKVACCTLQCGGANPCGDDGCGGVCGTCGAGELCTGGQCEVCAEDPGGEPNETCAAAVPLATGLHTDQLLCPDTDEDWYRLTLSEGQHLTVTLAQADEGTGLELQLVPPSCGTPLTY
ncbi:MAG: hypothetical protein FJ098_16715, partial [Deltaproteobacteria bacterium]|nr:hypothetical protein [Deltaproteobacteria bacterium]